MGIYCRILFQQTNKQIKKHHDTFIVSKFANLEKLDNQIEDLKKEIDQSNSLHSSYKKKLKKILKELDNIDAKLDRSYRYKHSDDYRLTMIKWNRFNYKVRIVLDQLMNHELTHNDIPAISNEIKKQIDEITTFENGREDYNIDTKRTRAIDRLCNLCLQVIDNDLEPMINNTKKLDENKIKLKQLQKEILLETQFLKKENLTQEQNALIQKISTTKYDEFIVLQFGNIKNLDKKIEDIQKVTSQLKETNDKYLEELDNIVRQSWVLGDDILIVNNEYEHKELSHLYEKWNKFTHKFSQLQKKIIYTCNNKSPTNSQLLTQYSIQKRFDTLIITNDSILLHITYLTNKTSLPISLILSRIKNINIELRSVRDKSLEMIDNYNIIAENDRAINELKQDIISIIEPLATDNEQIQLIESQYQEYNKYKKKEDDLKTEINNIEEEKSQLIIDFKIDHVNFFKQIKHKTIDKIQEQISDESKYMQKKFEYDKWLQVVKEYNKFTNQYPLKDIINLDDKAYNNMIDMTFNSIVEKIDEIISAVQLHRDPKVYLEIPYNTGISRVLKLQTHDYLLRDLQDFKNIFSNIEGRNIIKSNKQYLDEDIAEYNDNIKRISMELENTQKAVNTLNIKKITEQKELFEIYSKYKN